MLSVLLGFGLGLGFGCLYESLFCIGPLLESMGIVADSASELGPLRSSSSTSPVGEGANGETEEFGGLFGAEPSFDVFCSHVCAVLM